MIVFAMLLSREEHIYQIQEEERLNSKELKAERVKLFRDAENFRKTDRIPYFANVVTWKVFDAGHTLDEAMTDFKVMEECVLHFLNE